MGVREKLSLWQSQSSLLGNNSLQQISTTVWQADNGSYINLLELPCQSTTNLVAQTVKMYCLIILEARNLKSRCQQDWFIQKDMRENLFHASFLVSGGLLAIFSVPWLWQHNSKLYMVFSLGACLYPVSVFYQDTNYFGWGPSYYSMTS